MPKPNLTLEKSEEASPTANASKEYMSEGGTFLASQDGPMGDLRVNKIGMKVKSQTEVPSGFRLEDLELGTILGKGISSTVMLATIKSTGTQLALKKMQVHDEKARQQFLREVQALIGCPCPNLVRLSNAFCDAEFIYIALEFMDAGTLKDVLDKYGQMPEILVASVTKQILISMTYLHSIQHTVHRDLKPENVLVNKEGEVKTSDLGMSRQLENTAALAESFVGTALYMAPERMMGQEYGFSSDIWSVGLIALELSLGQHPGGKSAPKTFIELYQTFQDAPPKPSDDASPDFKAFLDQCLNKDPKGRSSADELLRHPFIANVKDEKLHVHKWINRQI